MQTSFCISRNGLAHFFLSNIVYRARMYHDRWAFRLFLVFLLWSMRSYTFKYRNLCLSFCSLGIFSQEPMRWQASMGVYLSGLGKLSHVCWAAVCDCFSSHSQSTPEGSVFLTRASDSRIHSSLLHPPTLPPSRHSAVSGKGLWGQTM